MVLAIASSSSIGAWAIWREYSWVWAGIIAFSQVVTAATPFLPYKKIIKSYSALIHELEDLMIKSESKWHAISDGKLTSSEINKARFYIRATK